MSYDVIIGLEVHVQLQTQTKVFCGCSTAFNPQAPNTQTCPTCLGLPGALPVLNKKAFELAVQTAMGLNCEIPLFTKWDRKQYFYPDLPKGYQISQYDLPFSRNGHLDVPPAADGDTPIRVCILRAHLEEDAGKNLHDESGRGAGSMIDLNRAGTPLVEIVTEPDLRDAVSARRFLEELRLLLVYLGVSDCNMQEGSLRCDANVNLHVHGPNGTKIPTPIVEVKNLNSFRFTEQAIEFEVTRQWEQYQKTKQTIKDAPKVTRGFDPDRGVTYALREKEEAADYRYFPDPDLVPVTVTEEQLSLWRSQLVESPASRRERFRQAYGLSLYDAQVILDQGVSFADYFEQVASQTKDGKQAANWLTQEVQRVLNDRRWTLTEFPFPAPALGHLLSLVSTKKITSKSAKDVFNLLVEGDEPQVVTAKAIDATIAERGLALVEDTGAIDAAIAEVISRNPKAVQDFRSGKQAAAGALIGQVMKAVKGADPQSVRGRLLKQLEG
jgi:aspartyl-tRNA(Asn)/glutamyl-tRNA(Gln) amidotransferase subunit B